jgi:large subunit ribosomal protein L5
MAKEKQPKAGKEQKKAPEAVEQEVGVTPRFLEMYKKTIIGNLMSQFQYKNLMQVPKLDKICINTGVGQATQDAKLLDSVVKDMETIIGQKAVITRAKKAISNFKLRQGLPIGVRVTLRSNRMYEFMDRFISVAVPRIRDFRGFSDRSFDGHGNYTVGVKEHIIFPEIDIDKVAKVFGMDITFVTTARTDQEAYALLKEFGMPFEKRQTPIEKKSE